MEPFEKIIYDFKTETFNLGADKYYEILHAADILQNISKKYQYNCIIEHKEKRFEAKDAYCDHNKAKILLNFKDETNIYDLIEKMFLWAEKQPKRELKTMNYELEKNIYSYWK